MQRQTMTKEAIIAETEKVLGELSWAKSEDGIDWHLDKSTSHPSSIVTSIIEDGIRYGIEQGWNPAAIWMNVGIRLWGQYPKFREDIMNIAPRLFEAEVEIV